jgi:hypothetical protein
MFYTLSCLAHISLWIWRWMAGMHWRSGLASRYISCSCFGLDGGLWPGGDTDGVVWRRMLYVRYVELDG